MKEYIIKLNGYDVSFTWWVTVLFILFINYGENQYDLYDAIIVFLVGG